MAIRLEHITKIYGNKQNQCVNRNYICLFDYLFISS